MAPFKSTIASQTEIKYSDSPTDGDLNAVTSDGVFDAIQTALGNNTNTAFTTITESSAYFARKLGDDIDGATAGDHLGVSVALSSDGTRLAAGAAYAGSYKGYARVYEYNCIPES